MAEKAQVEADRLRLIAVANEKRAAALRRTLMETEQRLGEAVRANDATRQDLDAQRLELAHLRAVAEQYHVLIQSSLWRATGPLRAAGSMIPPWLRRVVRRWRPTRQPAPLAPPPPAAAAPPPPVIVDRFSLDQVARPPTDLMPLIEFYDPIAPEVSIVIVNWNGGDMTLLCLEYLWQYTTGHHYEIIVVDNGSDPGDTQKLRDTAPYARIIELGTNKYFGEANNLGVEAALGRYVCLLNNDAFVAPGWLETLMRALESDRSIGAVGPRFVYPNGDLQEAGALINPDGTVTQLGKGASLDDPAFRTQRVVDYTSAACVLLRRDDFMRALGFDLAWDPAYYEDVDLCLKLRLLGLDTVYCPDTTVVHIEGATSSNRGAALKLGNIVAINRTKFLHRWSRFLETAGRERPPLIPTRPAPAASQAPRRRVVIYTPYALTLGGGERYLLTIAVAFKDVAHVALVTPEPVSRLRVLTMGREFGLDLDHVQPMRAADCLNGPAADLAFVLGNELFPTIGRLGRHTVFICRLPVAASVMDTERRPFWGDVDRVMTGSEDVRAHVQRSAEALGVPARPIDVVPPPVPMVTMRAVKQPGRILHVGRFATGGRCERQDRLIEALRSLLDRGVAAELHLAGSTMPEVPHRTYYAELLVQAAGLPVTFHTNPSMEALHQLYASSDVYWHGAFGISMVEAMSARCIPIVFAAGDPASDDLTGLVDQTDRLLRSTPDAEKDAMRDAAEAAAQAYDEALFRRRIRALAEQLMPETLVS